MNQTKPKTIEDILNKFDVEFGGCYFENQHGYDTPPHDFKGNNLTTDRGLKENLRTSSIKSFIRQEITTLLESLKREEKPETILDKRKDPQGYTVTTVINNPNNDAVKEFN